MELGTKTLTALVNEHLKRTGETVKELAGAIRPLTPQDRVWFAERFVIEGYADVVTSKDALGGEIILHRRAL